MSLHLKNFSPRPGEHCETSTLGMMLAHEGLVLSEAMLFGLGAGLDFKLWPVPEPRRTMPIASGRIDSGRVARNAADRLGVELVVQEAETPAQAREHVEAILGRNRVAGLKLDIFHLHYFKSRRHFAAHYVALHGLDLGQALVVDTAQQGGTHRLSVEQLALARDSREGFQPSRNLSMYVDRVPASLGDGSHLEAIPLDSLLAAIRECAGNFLAERPVDCGPSGMRRLAGAMARWHEAFDDPRDVVNGIAHFWRFAGTGGANFRRLYREFLQECGRRFDRPLFHEAAADFEPIVQDWDAVIDGLMTYGRDGDTSHLERAGQRFAHLAERESQAMGRLLAATRGRSTPPGATGGGAHAVHAGAAVAEVKTLCRMCHGGCGAIVTLTDGLPVDIRGDASSPVSEGFFCAKGKAALGLLGGERLTTPLRRVVRGGRADFEPISWAEALDLVAAKLQDAKRAHGAESVVLAQGTDRNYQEWVFRLGNVFGTPNVLGPAHICFYPRVMASILTFGAFTFSDYEGDPEAIFVWGSNKLHTHSDGVIGIKLAKALKRGAKLIVVDPLRTALARQADCWLQIRPGTDGALALGMLHLVIENGWFDGAFVEQHTQGFEALRAHVRAYDLETCARLTGLAHEDILRATRLYATAARATIEAGTGLSQNRNAFDTLRSVFMLSALCGNLDAEGGDVIWEPMAVDGRRTFPLTELLPQAQQARRLGGDRHRVLSMTGWAHPDAVWDALLTDTPYPVAAMVVFGSNLLATQADTERVHRALTRLPFLVVCDLFMTPTARMADVVLPTSSWLERDQVVEFNAYVGARRKLAQVGESRSDEAIILELAARLGLSEHFWPTVEDALAHKLKGLGHTWESFKDVGFIPNQKRYRKYRERGFRTPSGKLSLFHVGLQKMGYSPLPEYVPDPPRDDTRPLPYLLTSAHSPFFYNSEYHQVPALHGRQARPLLTLHPEAAAREGLHAGERVFVHVAGREWGVEFEARLSRDVAPDVVYVDSCWWYPAAATLTDALRSNINALTRTDDRNPAMGSTPLRGFRVALSKAARSEHLTLELEGPRHAP
ncbi:molybdopterin-dependent oxidoreductase [Myxococcus sp. K15C18031901]|uniref:molybdopterin-dependent oxidoreductase n=1 Tax=Myxococcus dinghuensis TaxID=2906761 RepID=UPI0020A70751|nr:molybdopterin-dependent oxidoreductase [Myxococcus dinghuensis]MCP3098106.1 molybdopterin-dependent oxidoreductase [Myxococcus dinghuensis]